MRVFLMRPHRLSSLGLAGCLGVVLSATFLANIVGAQALPIDNRILVRVNDRIVTKYDYQRQVAAAMAALTQQVQDPDELNQRRQELPRQVLRGMWDDLLILSRADQLGLTISDYEVDEAISDQMVQFGMETREELEAALAQSGLSMPVYRKNLRSQMLQRSVMGKELFPRVVIEEDELRRVYRDNLDAYQVQEARELEELVVLETEAGSELDTIAARVANAWSRGQDGQEIAEREGNAVRYISLGSVERANLAPVLAEVAFEIAQGQVSEPLVARGGLHILRVAKIVAVRTMTFEEVREQVDQDERMRRMVKERDLYLRELEKKAYYEANLPSELADFRTSTGFHPGAGGLSEVSSTPLGVVITDTEEKESDEGSEKEPEKQEEETGSGLGF